MSMVGANLISMHGHFLVFDRNERALVGRFAIADPGMIYVDIHNSQALFYIIESDKRVFITFGRHIGLDATQQSGSTLIAHPCESYFYRFEASGFYLSANPDGTCDFKIWKEIFEKFFILRDNCLTRQLFTRRWFSWTQKQVVPVTIDTDHRLKIGELETSLVDIETYGSFEAGEIVTIYDAYCVERLSAYDPLIYLTAFGDETIFEALSLCIASIEAYGDYDGRYLVLTDRSSEEVLALMPATCRSRLDVRTIMAFDVIDYVNTRFRIVELSEFAHHQPIVYVDIDIICTGALAPLLEIPLRGGAIYTRREGLIDLPHYGNGMTRRDRFSRTQKEHGFNSGVIAFRDLGQVRLIFNAILASLRSHLQTGLNRSSTEAYDQPVANYVFNCIATFDVDALVCHVHPCPPELDDIINASGLVHFYGGVGAVHKIDRMRRFSARIARERHVFEASIQTQAQLDTVSGEESCSGV